MKSFATLILIFCFTVLVSCNGETEAKLVHTSPNKKVALNIQASRVTSVDPWQVVMKVKAYSFKEGSLDFEIYSDNLNNETVLFNWEDETHCKIIFKQNDGVDKTFSLIASPEKLEMIGF